MAQFQHGHINDHLWSTNGLPSYPLRPRSATPPLWSSSWAWSCVIWRAKPNILSHFSFFFPFKAMDSGFCLVNLLHFFFCSVVSLFLLFRYYALPLLLRNVSLALPSIHILVLLSPVLLAEPIPLTSGWRWSTSWSVFHTTAEPHIHTWGTIPYMQMWHRNDPVWTGTRVFSL